MISISEIIDLAIREDLGDGDHTTLSTIPANAEGSATLFSKDEGILAGVQIAKTVFEKIDSSLKLEVFMNDGDKIKKGDKIFTVSGKAQSILQAERLMLNFMQRMSGIATQTNNYAKIIADLPTKILDTRKTTPNMRVFEKMAVEMGGGMNHRMGLYDMVMIKDNHIDFAGGIEQAIIRVNNYLKEKNK
ncbi:MAG: carboxylating nicotinate-nucleotide diphosphorylase, partial [Bacteroidales bacterium]|nr:carboxylating nicotinate-nucleotide diphosphorylase [Bacteroidales bacterium]